MGTSLTHQPSSTLTPNTQFLSRIQKVSTSSSQHFGNYSIYQLQQKPYSYYLEFVETTIPQSDLLQQKLQFYNTMPKYKNLVPVEYAQIVKRKQLCAQFDGLSVFCMYYNFTLDDGIRLKIKQRAAFTEGEAIYILKGLLSIGKFYQNELKGAYYSGIYQTKKVYVSPEGHVKIYPFNQFVFSAYSDMLMRDEEVVESEYVESKKVSIGVCEEKNTFEFASEMAVSKNLPTNKSQMGIKRSKLTTTLKKDSALSSVSSKQSLGHEIHGLNRAKPSQSVNNQESCQSLNYLCVSKNKPPQLTNKRDMFELGLLMMQLILLNESHEYYTAPNRSNETIASSPIPGVHSRMQTSRDQTSVNANHATNGLMKYKYVEEYYNDSGKVPNVDLIHFSLTKLMPKKNISKPLLNLIETMIFPQQNSKFTIDELCTHVQRIQELAQQTKHCIKFDNIKEEPQNNDLNMSKYLVKTKSTDPFMKTADLSYVFGGLDSANHSKILTKNILDPSISKESFFSKAQNLQELLIDKNLASSMIAQDLDYEPDSSQILNSLKKSRKLVTTKLRSISTKGPEKPNQIQEPVSSQRYKLNFG